MPVSCNLKQVFQKKRNIIGRKGCKRNSFLEKVEIVTYTSFFYPFLFKICNKIILGRISIKASSKILDFLLSLTKGKRHKKITCNRKAQMGLLRKHPKLMLPLPKSVTFIFFLLQNRLSPHIFCIFLLAKIKLLFWRC